MENRRQHIRVSKSLEVKYRILNGFLRSGSRSTDVSKGGICLPIIQRLDSGTTLELEICLGEMTKSIEAIGEVVWLSHRKGGQFPFEVGIKFIKIAPIDIDKNFFLC
jgi:c-di-GMP-binding flagellar brake protein YcgR